MKDKSRKVKGMENGRRWMMIDTRSARLARFF